MPACTAQPPGQAPGRSHVRGAQCAQFPNELGTEINLESGFLAWKPIRALFSCLKTSLCVFMHPKCVCVYLRSHVCTRMHTRVCVCVPIQPQISGMARLPLGPLSTWVRSCAPQSAATSRPAPAGPSQCPGYRGPREVGF